MGFEAGDRHNTTTNSITGSPTTVRDTLNLIHELFERRVGLRNLADPIRDGGRS